MTCMNCLGTEIGYHNVAIWLGVKVDKEQYSFKNMEPTKHNDWEWVKWTDFIHYKPLFIPFKYFFEAGYTDLDKVKQLI